MTEAALAANRANAQKAGRPPGKEKIELRDRIRARETDIVEHLFHLAFHAQSETAQVGSLRELLDRGWGPGVDGLGPVMLQVCTGVATPDQWAIGMSRWRSLGRILPMRLRTSKPQLRY
jgi:hypothetical protein